MKKLMVVLTENTVEGYFTVSVQERNEHGGRNLWFSYHHWVPFEDARSMVLEAVEFEFTRLSTLLKECGCEVEEHNYANNAEGF